MSNEQIDEIIEQIINGAVATIPAYLEEIKENKEIFQSKDPKEFIFGIILGMALGISGVIVTQNEPPTEEIQKQIRDTVYKHIPDIRTRIFE